MTDSLPVGDILNDIVVEGWIQRASHWGRLRGHETATGVPVHIGISPSSTKAVAELQARLAYDVIGVGRCAFVGPLDRPNGADERECVAVVEVIGSGLPLTDAAPRMSDKARLATSVQLARTVARATRDQVVLAGIHPDLLWVDPSGGVDAVISPRFPVLIATKQRQRSTGPGAWPFSEIGPFVDPAMPNPWAATFASDVYCLGLVIAWLLGGEHPFAATQAAANGWLSAMEKGVRERFAEPPAIGAILDGMLVPDPSMRMPIDEVVSALESAVLHPSS